MSIATVLLAGALDQLVLLAVVLSTAGGAILMAELGVDAPLATVIGILGGLALLVACILVEIVVATRTGSTAGLLLLALRFDPSTPVHWADDAAEWILAYWRDLLLLPATALLLRVLGAERSREGPSFVHDPRATTLGGRLGRAAIVLVLLVSPVPLVVALAL